MALSIQYTRGVVSRQVNAAWPEGTYEDLLGRRGFFGRWAVFYRRHMPTEWTRIEGELRPRCFHSYRVETADMREARALPTVLFYNEDVRIAISRRREPMPYYFRNGDADELHFIHKGQGRYETDFGILAFRPGDYVVIPRGTTYRIVPETEENFLLVMESVREIEIPERGILGDWLPFDLGVLEVPEPQPVEGDGREYELVIKRGGELTSVFYDFCPIDVVGWRGSLAVFKLNIDDIRPITSEHLHVPPPGHCTFLNDVVMVCTYLPHAVAMREDAVRVPMYHRNIDYDEFTFMHGGRHISRHTVTAGMITLHPGPIHHGPYKESIERSRQIERFEWQAVAIDTVRPLKATPEAEQAEDREYYLSWRSGVSQEGGV